MKPVHVLIAALILLIGTPSLSSSQNSRQKESKAQTEKAKKPQKGTAPSPSANSVSKAKPAGKADATTPALNPPVGIKVQEKSNLISPPAETVRPIVLRDQKSPGLALGLSALLPGCGQYYNGDYLKGALQTGIFAAGVVVALTLGTESSYSSNAYTDYSYYGTYTYYRPSTEEWNSAWLYVGIGVAAGAWIWSVIDAPLSASNLNDEARGADYGHLLEMNKPSFAAGFDIGPTQRGVNMSVMIHF